ncbi:hypothetical protein [Nostoc sp.]|uniref:hypothetical protein n=1 Tax=Nostoc sp. TaxID=1180 RepID=UPI002FF6D826
MYLAALALQGDALTLYWDTLALQDIAKFNSPRINEMLYLELRRVHIYNLDTQWLAVGYHRGAEDSEKREKSALFQQSQTTESN